MSPQPSADQINKINELVGDPDFVKLNDNEQKILLGKVRGVPSLISSGPSKATQGTPVTTKDTDTLIDFLRPILSGTGASLATGAVGASGIGTGGISSFAAPAAGAATYTGIDALLQHLRSQPDQSFTSEGLGLKPGGVASTLVNTGQQALLNKVGESVIGGLMRGGKTLLGGSVEPEIQKFLPTTSQAAATAGMNKLAIVSKGFEDLALTAKQQALDKSAGAGFTQALQLAKDSDFNFSRNPNTMLDIISHDMPLGEGSNTPIKITPGQKYSPLTKTTDFILPTSPTVTPGEPNLNLVDSFSKLDKVIQDPKRLQDVLSTAQSNGVGDNLRKSLQGYQFMKIFNNAATRSVEGSPYSNNVIHINPKSLDSDWLNPEMQDSLKTLYNSKQRSDITQFFTNIANTQDKINANPIARKLFLLHGGIGLATGLLTGSVTGGAEAAAGSMLTFIGAQQVGKLLTNPKTARLLVAIAGGEPLGVSEQYAGKAITNVLNGSTVALMDRTGNKTPVTIRDGKFNSIGQ